MDFLDKRVLGICDQLKKLAVKQRFPLTGWQYKKGNFLRPQDAAAGAVPFDAFDSTSMHWYGPDEHYWFKTNLTVPPEMGGKAMWLHVRTQIEEWDDAKNPQFLLFVNDAPVQGLDMNHREVLLSTGAKAGETLHIDLQAYTGTLHSEFNFIAELWEVDAEIEGLYYDLYVPLSAFSRLEEESRAHMDLEHALNAAVNLLDLRTPYNDEFYATVREARAYLKQALYGALGGHSEVVASCIGHTHIDVAWWWTVAQTREKVARSFATVLKLMDEYPSYRFMSSQPQLYQFLKERYPELYERVKQRVAEGRWEAEGGTWVEPDCNLTSGESLARQFLYGKRFFKEEFGKDNRILWLPDVFGYSGALPQIMKLAGIEYFMTTKLAWNQYNKIPFDTFMWRGIDGTEILTHLITTLGVGQDENNFFTTYNGMLHPDALIGGWKRYQQKAINNDILVAFGYGDGGGGPTRAMLENADRLDKGIEGIPKVRQVFARTYFDELAARVEGNPRLPTWVGELYFEYHRGTYTSMARNKRSNRKAELHLMDLELLSVLADGLASSNGAVSAGETVSGLGQITYPKETLDHLWKVVLLNQFHDILPGTGIAEVYEVTRAEYAALEAEVAGLMAPRLAALAGGTNPANGIGTDSEAAPAVTAAASAGGACGVVTVVNTTGFVRGDVVALGNCPASALKDESGAQWPVQQTETGAVAYLEGLPPKGYKAFELVDASEQLPPANAGTAPAASLTPALAFAFHGDRLLETPFYTVAFNENGLIERLFDKDAAREVAGEGGLLNLMRMYEDKPIYYDNWDIDIYYTEKSWDVTDLTRFEWTENGPVRATLSIERQVSNSVIRQNIRFYANSRRIDFETEVDWQEHQHLLKVHFPVNVHTDEATFDIQFGNLTRKTHQNTSWDRARFESCGQKWMDLSEGHYGVSLLNDCKYGHSVKDNCIALTLIKSGIEPNPNTDCETHVFTYALWPHSGGWREGGTVAQGYFLNQPAYAVPGETSGANTAGFSLVSTSARNAVLETVKRAEDGDGFIVRVYECDNALTPVELRWNRPFTTAEECNLLEERLGPAEVADGAVSFALKPYEIKSFRIC